VTRSVCDPGPPNGLLAEISNVFAEVHKTLPTRQVGAAASWFSAGDDEGLDGCRDELASWPERTLPGDPPDLQLQADRPGRESGEGTYLRGAQAGTPGPAPQGCDLLDRLPTPTRVAPILRSARVP
jgi:hypothetical protein